jgi:hypothetical protein
MAHSLKIGYVQSPLKMAASPNYDGLTIPDGSFARGSAARTSRLLLTGSFAETIPNY